MLKQQCILNICIFSEIFHFSNVATCFQTFRDYSKVTFPQSLMNHTMDCFKKEQDTQTLIVMCFRGWIISLWHLLLNMRNYTKTGSSQWQC